MASGAHWAAAVVGNQLRFPNEATQKMDVGKFLLAGMRSRPVPANQEPHRGE